MEVQLGSREKGRVAKHGFAKSTPQKAVRILKHAVGMVVTHQWELSELGGKILELESESLHKNWKVRLLGLRVDGCSMET